MAPRPPHALLTRHFLRRFLENDLIAPDADRSLLLATVGAAFFSTSLFISVILSFNYAIVSLTPAQAALAATGDRYVYISLALVVVALLAVAQWDALTIDTRDAAILEPLPIRPHVVRRAKLTAVAVFGVAAAVAVNAIPSVIFPPLLVSKLEVGVPGVLTLLVTHATVTMLASLFGYAAVVALRELLTAMLGHRLFARVSPLVQGALILTLGSALLLTPAGAANVQRAIVSPTAHLSPTLWFLGVYETLAGHVVADSPAGRLTLRQERGEMRARATFDRSRPFQAPLAARVPLAFAIVTTLGALGYWRNTTRSPELAPPLVARRWRRSRAVRALVATTIARHPATRAGFFFTASTMWRSSTHRITLAAGAALGLALALVTLFGADLGAAAGGGRAMARLLSIQPLLIGPLLVAFRHIIRVPAELRANWGFELGWRGDERRFLAGARRAAIVCLVVPALLVVMPITAYALGLPLAVAHAGLGLIAAMAILEAMLVTYDKVPFTCSYVPSENMKALGPIYALSLLLGTLAFASLERAALTDLASAVNLLLFLGAVFIASRAMSAMRRRPPVVDFNEAPAGTQQLGLHT